MHSRRDTLLGLTSQIRRLISLRVRHPCLVEQAFFLGHFTAVSLSRPLIRQEAAALHCWAAQGVLPEPQWEEQRL